MIRIITHFQLQVLHGHDGEVRVCGLPRRPLSHPRREGGVDRVGLPRTAQRHQTLWGGEVQEEQYESERGVRLGVGQDVPQQDSFSFKVFSESRLGH